MTTFLALYTQAPFWVWLAAAACFAALNLATGQSVLLWTCLAAGAVAVFKALGLKLGLALDLPLFIAITGGGLALSRRLPTPAQVQAPPQGEAPEPSRRADPRPIRAGTPEYSARLIGRIARTTGRFANGVGRVWIDGAEWAAELGGSEDDLAPDTPVRIMRVVGAIKLEVCTLK